MGEIIIQVLFEIIARLFGYVTTKLALPLITLGYVKVALRSPRVEKRAMEGAIAYEASGRWRPFAP